MPEKLRDSAANREFVGASPTPESTKYCSRCHTTKSYEDFYFTKGRRDGLSAWCKTCNRAYAKTYSKRNRDRAVEFVNRVKSRIGCQRCGVKQSYLLQFHHLETDTKEATISQLTQRMSGKPSYEKIKSEMRKCVVLCANHHLEFHHLERTTNTTIAEFIHRGVAKLD